MPCTTSAEPGLEGVELLVVSLEEEDIHELVRELVSERLGVAPEALSFGRVRCPRCGGPHGRPAITAPPGELHFSLARSQGKGLIGIAERPIGVDIEAIPNPDLAADVTALLHPDERAEVLSVTEAERPERFAQIWTRKEAYLKGIGVGIATELGAEYLGERRSAWPAGWTIAGVCIGAGYAAAVAVVSS